MIAPARQRSARRPARAVVVWLRSALLIVALVLTACSDGDPLEPDADPEDGAAVEQTAVPEVPDAPEPEDDATEPLERPIAPQPAPRAGDVVLVHLEGPVVSPEATDVVIRDEAGQEVDRFRLASAVDVHAGAEGRAALIATSAGQWARYDATANTLSLLTFDGDPPVGPPVMVGAVAYWDDPNRPWAVRLDTGQTMSLRGQMGETGAVTGTSPDGSHLLLRGARDHVVTTADGSVRTLPGQSGVTLSADGTTLASTVAGSEGVDVFVEAVEGAGRRLIGTVETDGFPVAFGGGRVLLLGPVTRIVEPGGTSTELLPTPGVTDAIVDLAGDHILAVSPGALLLVDPGAGTVARVPNSADHLVARGSQRVFWAVSADPTAPGATVIDPETGQTAAVLEETVTTAVTSISDDGRIAILQVGMGGTDSVLATADGVVQPLQAGATRVEATLHPSGETAAIAIVADATRTLLIGDVDDPSVEVPTARAPAWVRTTLAP